MAARFAELSENEIKSLLENYNPKNERIEKRL